MNIFVPSTVIITSVLFASTALAGNDSDRGFTTLISTIMIYLFVVVIVFLIFREFFCWYWKINRRISILEDISATNIKILEHLQKNVKTTNTHEQQKVLDEIEKLEAQGEESKLAARKLRVPTLNNRYVCPKCFKDFSIYMTVCETCNCQLEPSDIVAQKIIGGDILNCCKQCGDTLNKNDTFCTKCGLKVEGVYD